MRTQCAGRGAQGVTLVELMVVLSILGLILGVTGLALGSLRVPRESERVTALRRARTDAIHSGSPRAAHGVRFLPDGRAIGAGIDALTGVPDGK